METLGTFVPSTVTRPSPAKPSSRARRTTSANSAPNASTCVFRKSHSVRCFGKFPAASIRNATSSSRRRASFRGENTPVAYPYTSTFTTIRGSYGRFRRPSPSYRA